MFYKPVLANRYFTRYLSYADLQGLVAKPDFDGVVDAFEERMAGWYLDPVRYLRRRKRNPYYSTRIAKFFRWEDPGHFAFDVMAVDCLLIDALSQYVTGKLSASRGIFIDFITDHMPQFSGTLDSFLGTTGNEISHFDHGQNTTAKKLTKVAEVIYYGFRCGIVHQAHAPLYCSIDPGGARVQVLASSKAEYGPSAAPSLPGQPCPSVVINPWLLFDDLEQFFQMYLAKLKQRDHQFVGHFKTKFSDSFGIDITHLA